MPPSLVRYRELPISNFFEWDRVHEVRAVLRQLQLGAFSQAALLVDDMGRDDRIAGCLNIRLARLLGRDMKAEPARLTRIATRMAEGAQQLWPRMVPKPAQADLLKWGLMLGIGVGELLWDTTGTDGTGRPSWVPRMKVWHPQFLRWDWSREAFILTTANGEVVLPRVDDQVHSDGHWVIFTPYGFRYGWLRAMVRPLAMPFLIRGWTYRDAARYSEVHGQPIRKAIAPTTASATSKARFEVDVGNLGSESTLLLEQSPDGGKFDLELLEAKADTFQVFDMLLGRVEESIATCILGSSPGGKQSGLGSGQATQDEAIRDDTAAADGEALGTCLNDQVAYWWAVHNWGPQLGSCITVGWNMDPPEDELAEAQLLQALATALQIFQAAGAPVDVRALLDAHGVPMLDPADVLDQPMEPPPAPGAVPPAAPPDGGQQPDAPAAPAGPPQGAEAQALDGDHPEGDQLPLVDFQGLQVRVENPIGSTRTGVDPDGKPWATVMQAPYGYLEGQAGPDGDAVDCFLGPDPSSQWVFIVHTHRPPTFRAWDEDKVMLGWTDPTAARDAFLAHYNDPRFLGRMTMIPMEQFKRKLRTRTSTGMIRAAATPAPGATPAPAQRAVALSGLHLDAVVDPRTREALAASMATQSLQQQLAGRPAYGAKRALRYADRLAVKAAKAGGAAVKVDLKLVMQQVAAARDYQDLQARLLDTFRGMDPAKLARVVERASIMAELAGRHDVLQAL